MRVSSSFKGPDLGEDAGHDVGELGDLLLELSDDVEDVFVGLSGLRVFEEEGLGARESARTEDSRRR